MKKFQFRLQTLLDLREKLEEQAKRDHGRSLSRIDDANRRVDDHRKLIREALALGSPPPGSRIDIDTVVGARRWVVTLEAELERLQAAVAQAEGVARATQESLAAAARDRQVLTKLKERHFEDWKREALRQEQAELDEVALNVIRRRSG